MVSDDVRSTAAWLEMPDGARLRLRDEGSPGPVVVLVHGWKGSHRLWDDVAARLVADGHRVVRADHRWMGESDQGPGPYTVDTLARDLRHVIELLSLRDVVLVGWSMGCSVVLRLLEECDDSIIGVVLHNGPIRLVSSADFPYGIPPAQLQRYLETIDASWPEGERAFQAESLLDPHDVGLLDRLCAAASSMTRPAVTEIVRSQALLDMSDCLRALRIPVLAAYSEHDPYYPPSIASYIASTALRGRSHTFTRSAHCTPIEEPEAFAEVVKEFVRDC